MEQDGEYAWISFRIDRVRLIVEEYRNRYKELERQMMEVLN
jgi:hypothetical protein